MTTPMSRRQFLRTSAGVATLAVAAGVYALEIEKRWLDIVEIDMALSRLQPGFEGYRIAHISDIHMDGVGMTVTLLSRVVRVINDLGVDLVVVTGDYVHVAPREFAPQVARTLAQLTAPDGVLAVLGNHDHWTDASVVRGALHGAGIKELENTVHVLERDGDALYIGGTDDAWEQKANLAPVLAALPDNACAILLQHEPDYADFSAQTGRFDLQLSGHTHGGQVRLPGGQPLVTPTLGQKYHNGLYRVDNMLQYTNRGLGTIPPYVRINCRAEVTVFTLKATE